MLNIVIPFVERDRHQAERLLNWMKELGGIQSPLYLLAPQSAQPDGLLPLAKEVSPRVEIILDREEIISDWHTDFHAGRSAIGPNSIFRQCAMHFLDVDPRNPRNLGPFLFLEPDSIPCQKGWDMKLDEEYQKCGKPFMGAYVPGGDGYPEHMSGVAIWPQQTFSIASDAMRAEKGAFDVVGASQIVPQAHFTSSIVHKFRHKGFSSREDMEELVKPDTLVFHANKDGSLIPLLRERLSGNVTQRPEQDRSRAVLNEGSTPSIPVIPVVHTYYEEIEGRDTKEQEWMLATWADSWRQYGWSPKVIGPPEAKTHPFYKMFLERFMTFPTVNGKQYELACFIRWVAMVQVGGGLMVDYDVMNRGFRPSDLVSSQNKLPLIMADNNPCPCGVYGTAAQYDTACRFMAERGDEAITAEGGRLHLSDQHIVQHFKEFSAKPIIYQYGQAGWENAKLVHFSSGSCQGRPRSKVIPSVMDLRSDEVKSKPMTWIGEVRSLVERLDSMGDTPMRRKQISQEIKKHFSFRIKK